MARFGSLPSLLAVTNEELDDLQVPEGIIEVLDVVRNVLSRVLSHELLDRPLMSTDAAVISYLHGTMARLSRETFRVLFLDSGNRLILEKVMWEGSAAKVQIHPREILRVALQCGATALIIAHNHPSGDSRPSRADIDNTERIFLAASNFEIVLHDHIIVSRSGWFSLRAEGWLGKAASS